MRRLNVGSSDPQNVGSSWLLGVRHFHSHNRVVDRLIIQLIQFNTKSRTFSPYRSSIAKRLRIRHTYWMIFYPIVPHSFISSCFCEGLSNHLFVTQNASQKFTQARQFCFWTLINQHLQNVISRFFSIHSMWLFLSFHSFKRNILVSNRLLTKADKSILHFLSSSIK